MKKNRAIFFFLLCLVLASSLFTTGCGKKQIFEKKGDEFNLKALSDEELENDVYYVKQGAEFYATYLPDGTSPSSKPTTPDESELLWTGEDNSLIPTLYGNEILAYRSDKTTSLTNITLERYKDVGYSFGVYGGSFDTDGYYAFDISSDTLANTSINAALQNMSSDSIRIVSINDTPVSSFALAGGVICGLEKGKNYTLNIYDGTRYTSITASPDMHFYQAYEVHTLEPAKNTKKNYLRIDMLPELKSGYYKINGAGLFRYYAYERGSEQIAEIDMNEASYSGTDGQNANVQQFVASVPTQSTNVLFSVSYSTTLYRDEDVSCVLQSPDGTTYDMECLNGLASVNIATAMAGRWTISITPKELEVIEVFADSSALNTDTVQDTYEFDVADGKKNMKFVVNYIGEGEIWGSVEDEGGNSTPLTNVSDAENKQLYAIYPYLAEGHYIVHVYHYSDAAVKDVKCISDTDNETVDVITVED